jgi:PEP-CTERM motif
MVHLQLSRGRDFMRLMQGAAAAALGLAILGAPADAALVIDVYQNGDNVVATGSGSSDRTELTIIEAVYLTGTIWPSIGIAAVGGGDANVYSGPSGPASFGAGGQIDQSSGSGPLFGVNGSGFFDAPALYIPSGYTSGTALSGSSTFDGQTIASLGLTPGTYVYTWGSGADADSLTVNISGVPEPSTWAMMLLGFAGLGLAGYRTARKGLSPPPDQPHIAAGLLASVFQKFATA